MRRKLAPLSFAMVALFMGAVAAAMAPSAESATMDFYCEDDARCAHLNPSEWCTMELLDTYCQYYPDGGDPDNPAAGHCNTWSSGSCPFT